MTESTRLHPNSFKANSKSKVAEEGKSLLFSRTCRSQHVRNLVHEGVGGPVQNRKGHVIQGLLDLGPV